MQDVSIIVPTYKPQAYLYDCLFSLSKQTCDHFSFEVIIVLNGPKRPYYELISKYLDELNNINSKLEYCSEPGVSNARNMGLDIAKGKYIGFLDDDDIISPNYLDSLLKIIEPNCIACSNVKTFETTIDNLGSDYLSISYNKCKSLVKKTLLNSRSFLSVSWAKLIPVNVINGRTFDTKFKIGEDSLFMFSISNRIKTIKLSSPNTIYYRRIRANSAFRKNNSFFFELKNTIGLMISFFKIFIKSPMKYNFFFNAN